MPPTSVFTSQMSKHVDIGSQRESYMSGRDDTGMGDVMVILIVTLTGLRNITSGSVCDGLSDLIISRGHTDLMNGLIS
jgi:hypothetical protein